MIILLDSAIHNRNVFRLKNLFEQTKSPGRNRMENNKKVEINDEHTMKYAELSFFTFSQNIPQSISFSKTYFSIPFPLSHRKQKDLISKIETQENSIEKVVCDLV